KLGIDEEYELKWRKVIKNGITATKFDVILQDLDHGHIHNHTHSHDHNHKHIHSHDHSHNHSHEHEHIHSHEHAHNHSHEHEHSHAHKHDHNHDHNHDHHHHHHRSYVNIVNMIERAEFNEAVTSTALAIFRKIGEAEGKIHDLPL